MKENLAKTPAAPSKLDTPLMRQYHSLKASYPHAILFFRLGDFYEMFGEDARVASPVLGLVLTSRQGLPMCGVPVHSASNYVARLLKAGHKVALAEQMEDPAAAKGLVKRQVVRLVTPGTVVEDELLDASSTNYLVAVEWDTVGWGVACLEASTGEFWATQALNDSEARQLLSLLARLDPAEVLVPRETAEALALKSRLGHRAALTFYERPRGQDGAETWEEDPAWRNRRLAARAARTAASYAAETQSRPAGLLAPSYRETHAEMQLDETAIRTLELTSSVTGDRRFSLWGLLDRCRTPMGSRRLKSWILHPLTDVAEIERRHHCVEELLEKAQERRVLVEILSEIADLERVSSRLATRAASPRDLAALRGTLGQLGALRAWLEAASFCSALATLLPRLDDIQGPLEETRRLLERALAERPPARLQDGGILRTGFNAELDELNAVKNDSQGYLAEMEAAERRSTGIQTLKIGYNSVFGYYIEVTRTHLAKVPERYARKQTLSNAERFLTLELKQLEAKILGAESKILKLEAALFESLRTEVLGHYRALASFAALLSELDVLAALAEVAQTNEYVKPKVDLSRDLVVEDGRHPMVEAALPAGAFVPNSTRLDGDDPRILILTGPNMGGKSTYLRQNALVAILAQMGSFVPASQAAVGVVDRILTRIGGQDALARNESTFMVEMRETAHILASATPRSLLILDEVGRGTSTFDGISIAWAVLEHLHAALARTGEASGPRVLFATHYFELTALAERLPGVRNANVEAREWTGAEGRTEVVFLHKIAPGPADRSFGIHVARLAGLPDAVLDRAREILEELESRARAGHRLEPGPAARPEPVLPLFKDHPVLEELGRLDPEGMTPLEALERLSAWKRLL